MIVKTQKELAALAADQRTLDAVLEIVEREAVARSWANETKMFRLLGVKIRRELGGTELTQLPTP